VSENEGGCRGAKKIALLTGSLLCISGLFSGKLFSQGKGGAMALHITSPEFSAGDAIPTKFTCDAQDVSPRLSWGEPPANTQSFALIMDDPDAPAGTSGCTGFCPTFPETQRSFQSRRRGKNSSPAARGKAGTISARSDTAGRVLRPASRIDISSSCTRSIRS